MSKEITGTEPVEKAGEDIDAIFDDLKEKSPAEQNAAAQQNQSRENGEKENKMIKTEEKTGPKQKITISIDKSVFDELTMIFKIAGELKKPEEIFGNWVDGKMKEVKEKVASQLKRASVV